MQASHLSDEWKCGGKEDEILISRVLDHELGGKVADTL